MKTEDDNLYVDKNINTIITELNNLYTDINIEKTLNMMNKQISIINILKIIQMADVFDYFNIMNTGSPFKPTLFMFYNTIINKRKNGLELINDIKNDLIMFKGGKDHAMLYHIAMRNLVSITIASTGVIDSEYYLVSELYNIYLNRTDKKSFGYAIGTNLMLKLMIDKKILATGSAMKYHDNKYIIKGVYFNIDVLNDYIDFNGVIEKLRTSVFKIYFADSKQINVSVIDYFRIIENLTGIHMHYKTICKRKYYNVHDINDILKISIKYINTDELKNARDKLLDAFLKKHTNDNYSTRVYVTSYIKRLYEVYTNGLDKPLNLRNKYSDKDNSLLYLDIVKKYISYGLVDNDISRNFKLALNEFLDNSDDVTLKYSSKLVLAVSKNHKKSFEAKYDPTIKKYVINDYVSITKKDYDSDNISHYTLSIITKYMLDLIKLD